MDHDQIMVTWRGHVRKVEELYVIYSVAPEQAALAGIVPVIEPESDETRTERFGGPPARRPVNQKAIWFRAIAEKEIPKTFRWEVTEAIGGEAFLALLDYRPDGEPETPWDFLRSPRR